MDARSQESREDEAGGPTLHLGDAGGPVPATPEAIARAVDAQPKDEDWYLIVGLPGDEVMEATREAEGSFRIEYEGPDGGLLDSEPALDADRLKAILASFLAGDGGWRSMARWESPKPGPAKAPPDPTSRLVWAAAAVPIVVAGLVLMGKGAWAGAALVLAIPFALAAAIAVKLREVRRAATWTKASGRILRSELVTRTHGGRDAQLPFVEYEFSVGFAKHRGSRVSIGEILPGSPQVANVPRLFPAGAGVTVYYNPADPRESVLDRDLPPHFNAIWAFVAVVAIACIAGAYLIVR